MQPPLFISGRQHSGNTMLATMLGRHPEVVSLTNEGTFFDKLPHLQALPSTDQATSIAHIIDPGQGHSMSPEESPDSIRESLASLLSQKAKAYSDSPQSLYRDGMAWLAEQGGGSLWCQKATSHVFYVEEILDTFPEARIVFLARNPLDLIASKKRRGQQERYLRTIWGWNKGFQIALEWRETPNLLFVRYEDLVRDPTTVVHEICDHAGLDFTSEMLNIPHVNRSETPFNDDSDTRGLNASRVFYYRDVLSPGMEAVVRRLSASGLLQSAYPDLPSPRPSSFTSRWAASLRTFGTGVKYLLRDHLSDVFSEPRFVVERIRRRL